MEDDEEPRAEKRYPLMASKMSKTPSWIMLGFLLGAAFVALLPPLRKKPAPEPPVVRSAEPPRAIEPRDPPLLTTIEAVFAEWGRHAVWSDDTTEVALWNSQDKDFTEFYEVRRFGDVLYFRGIPRLTRRIITRGKPLPESPLRFTETEEQYREWQKYGRAERPLEQRDIRPAPRNEPRTSPSLPRFETTTPSVTAPSLEGFAPKLETPPSTTPPSK